jgi:sugar-specific transcriptional regulator TrmB
LSQEQVFKTLVGLGLTRWDSQVYIYLAKRGPQKGLELSKGLNVQKQQLYRSLKNLQRKGIVNATLGHPARFNAVSFGKVVDIFIKAKMAEAQHIQEQKAEILANWQSISIGEIVDSTAKFNVIEGRGPIYAKILQMMNEAKNELSTIVTVIDLLRADQFGLFEAKIENQLRSKIKFRAITELSKQNLGIMKNLIRGIANSKVSFEGRTPDLSWNLPQLVIKDEEEVLFFITPKTSMQAAEQEDMCLWTNCKSLVQAFTTVFEDFWHNSTSINEKIAEIETGKPAPTTYVIKDTETAHKKYDEILDSAKKEITIVTSSEGLTELRQSKQFAEWTRKGIFVEIMAPITSENIETLRPLPQYCEIRHIPLGYLGTTIVDGKHLFQFKNAPQEQASKADFENTFYTNDSEYIEKTRTMLDEVWKNAQTPSTISLGVINRTNPSTVTSDSFDPTAVTREKVYGPTFIKNELKSQITEKTILDKIINPAKYETKHHSKTITFYGVNVQAIIHPPSYFKLPDLLFHILHFESQSTYGAGNIMLTHTWLKTPVGDSFIPASLIIDNAKSIDFWRRFCTGLPVEQNIKLVEKGQFQVHLHGNTALAAWTMPISIPPYNLPPSCILAEGSGNTRPGAHTIMTPSGYRQEAKYNASDAFITFLHPTSKYSGPGTDGVFARDSILEIYPPETKRSAKSI